MRTNNNFHILIVDDEPFNIELAEAYLEEEGYQLSFARNAQMTYEAVSKDKIDLILLDINMPDKDGFEVCESLKSDPMTKDIAVIFLTAQTDIEYISRAFDVGGADYISKPFFGQELKARVKTQLQKVDFLDEIKHKQSKLAQLTITDPLTKLYNSLYFDSQIKAYQNREENFWIIYLKIDRFEKINQVYGFFGANKIMRAFAKILEKVAYKNSIVAKLYGISFAILLKEYEIDQVKKIYEDITLVVNKNKDLSKIISFSTIIYDAKGSSDSVPTIYKKIQTKMQTIEDDKETKYLFIK